MGRRNWTRDELLKTLALYCQIPFGQMHARNLAVVALADSIDRTPSAVALKLVNFASLDPDLRERGIHGMGNSSTADREIWEEYSGEWDILAGYAMDSASVSTTQLDRRSESGIPQRDPSGPTETLREIEVRRGQNFFRTVVLAAYDGRCCITSIAISQLLRASHIVPWAKAPSLRLNPRNGLCLNALHDAAFDRGLISLSDKFEVMVARCLRKEVPAAIYQEMFQKVEGRRIVVSERFRPLPEMLEFHRSRVFQD
ncbi:HNH endonuclease [bacterium]|nr:HNH endonuclease [bacterium]